MLSRLPSISAQRKAVPRRRLTKERRRPLVEKVAEILRGGEPTAFARESICRHGIRGGLCLQGWRWIDADLAAADTVLAALIQIGARRPAWKEGQPEHSQDGYSPVERTRCVRCGGKLPEGHHKYCSQTCATSAHNWMWAKDHRAELAAYARAYRAAQRAERSRR